MNGNENGATRGSLLQISRLARFAGRDADGRRRRSSAGFDPAPRRQTPDASDIAEGARLFRQKGNCQSCHGWAGDGRKMDEQMPDGANLRETRLDRAALVMTIKCGLPRTGMPPFDKFAYSDGRCYGLKQADLAKAGQRMSDPPATLQNREIDFDGPRQVHRVLGPRDRSLRRVSEVENFCQLRRRKQHAGTAGQTSHGHGRAYPGHLPMMATSAINYATAASSIGSRGCTSAVVGAGSFARADSSR
jgi:mono/diheme cytochrome c family protein